MASDGGPGSPPRRRALSRAAAAAAGMAGATAGAAAATARPEVPRTAGRPGLADLIGFDLVLWGHAPWPIERLRDALEALASFGIRRVTAVTFRYVDPASGAVTHRSGGELPDAPSDALVGEVLGIGRRLGLRMSLAPLVERASPEGIGYRWRGDMTLEGRAREAFLDAYRDYVTTMAGLARAAGARRLFVGSELLRLSTDPALEPAWRGIVRAVREGARSGAGVGDEPLRLSYSANFSEYPDVTFWDALDEIAVSAYFALAEPDAARGPGRPSIDAMLSAWSGHLDALERFGRARGLPVAVSEWGLVPLDGASAAPWDVAPSEVPDPAEQLGAYAAVLLSLANPERRLDGFDFWHWHVGPESGPFAIGVDDPAASLIAATLPRRDAGPGGG